MGPLPVAAFSPTHAQGKENQDPSRTPSPEAGGGLAPHLPASKRARLGSPREAPADPPSDPFSSQKGDRGAATGAPRLVEDSPTKLLRTRGRAGAVGADYT